MPDIRPPNENPSNWSEAFAALPLESPPRDAWPALAAELRARPATTHRTSPRHPGMRWMALAAAVALAVIVPLTWVSKHHDSSPSPAQAASPSTTTDADQAELAALYAESAQLETLLAQVRDERVATGPAAALAGDFEARLATIDAALSEPALSPNQRLDLWHERTDALRQLAGFHSSQRLLAAQGERYDGRLVAVY